MLAVEAATVVAEMADVPLVVALPQQLALAGRDEDQMVEVDALVPGKVSLAVAGLATRGKLAQVTPEIVRGDVVLLDLLSRHLLSDVGVAAVGVRGVLLNERFVLVATVLGLGAGARTDSGVSGA